MNDSQGDTGWTLATAQGAAGISVVYLAGERTLDALSRIFRAPGGKTISFDQGGLAYGHIRRNDEVLDEVILAPFPEGDAVFRGPYAQINCHGGVIAAHDVGDLLTELGIEHLDAPAFLRRFGLLAPHAAHALEALLAAPTARAARVAADAFEGASARRLREITDQAERAQTPTEVDAALDAAETLLAAHRAATALLRPRRLTVVGEPNVGKSSLINALLAQERLLVHELPGTTRDTVEVSLALSGWPVTLIDTAGIRDADDDVESEGVTRTFEAARRADAVVVVLDATRPDPTVRERLDLPPGAHVLTALNKIDLVDASYRPDGLDHAIRASALTGRGLAELGKAILRETGLEGPATVAPALLDPDSAGELESLRQRLLDTTTSTGNGRTKAGGRTGETNKDTRRARDAAG